MPAYVIVDSSVLDEEGALRYRELAVPSIRLYGGRYLVYGGTVPEYVEGDWPADRRVAVLEFPDLARIKEWYSSPEYVEATAVRQEAIELRMLFVDGAPADVAPVE